MSPLEALAWGMALFAATACLRASDEPDLWPCTTNADCLDGNTCFREKCRPPGYCASDRDCAGLSACIEHSCVAVECTDLLQAMCSPFICRDNACLSACSTSSNCADGHACKGGQCVVEECSGALPNAACEGYVCSDGLCKTACTVQQDCDAGYNCVVGQCKKTEGSECTIGGQCGTGICCPTETPDLRRCATSCPLFGNGTACTWDAVCQSGYCKDSTCQICDTAECTARICANVECGPVGNVDCGGCPDQYFCNGNACELACQNRECGTSHGFDCGECSGKNYCDQAGQCQPACVNRECGGNQGIDCGTCPGEKDYCDAAGTCQPACVDRECGSNQGIDCGTCADGMVCDGGTCVEPICPVEQDYYCKQGSVYFCLGGLSDVLLDACTADEHCVENRASCQPNLCQANREFCYGEVFSTCDATGLGVLPGGRDCSAEQLDCTPAGCGIATTEWIGDCFDDLTTTAAMGNVFLITKTVTLVRFGELVLMTPNTNVRWFVYESMSEAGPYTQIAAATGGPGGDSPVLNVLLQQGRYYLLGSQPSTPTESIAHCYRNQLATTPLSVGVIERSYNGGGPVPPSVSDPLGPGTIRMYLYTVELQ